MNEIIDQIVELYFLGGDLGEILREARKDREDMGQYINKLYRRLFKSWYERN